MLIYAIVLLIYLILVIGFFLWLAIDEDGSNGVGGICIFIAGLIPILIFICLYIGGLGR